MALYGEPVLVPLLHREATGALKQNVGKDIHVPNPSNYTDLLAEVTGRKSSSVSSLGTFVVAVEDTLSKAFKRHDGVWVPDSMYIEELDSNPNHRHQIYGGPIIALATDGILSINQGGRILPSTHLLLAVATEDGSEISVHSQRGAARIAVFAAHLRR